MLLCRWKTTLVVLTLFQSTFSSVQAADEHELSCDLLIVGGTESGWAAALQAARMDISKIIIVHDGKWLGGQFTEQALACVDENKGTGKAGWGVDWHPMKRSFHRSGLFKELMDQIEEFNTEKYGSPMPGLPYHGPSTFRPAEAEAIFRKMLQPYLDTCRVRFITNRYPVRADVDQEGTHPRLTGLWFATPGSQKADLHVETNITIDASDWGEAIQVSGAAFEYGPDPPHRYREPSAPKNAPLNEMNPITWAMIVEQSAAETPVERPARFDNRNYPRATPFSQAKFRDLRWDIANPGLGSIPHWPDAGQASKRQLSVYSVRRIVDGYSSKDGRTSILLNYMNGQDYPLERLPQLVVDALEATEPGASQKNMVVMTREQREIIFQDAKRHSLGVLYHLQNFVHERAPDQTNSFRKFHLSREFGTPDNLPPKPYLREVLRLKAMYMMREQDGRNRDGWTKDKAKPRFAHVMYPDGLFAWQFHYDFHRTGRTYLTSEGTSGPWIDYHKPNRHTKFLSDRSVFPLRSLIPAEFDGLLGAQGNVGFSSIVSAAIRLHDQRIHIGQAAGATAAIALRTGESPRSFPDHRERLEAIRHALCGEVEQGVPLLIWPFRDLPSEHPSFVAVNRLAALNALPLGIRDVDFRPDDFAEPKWMTGVATRSQLDKQFAFTERSLTRGEFCQKIWNELQTTGFAQFEFQRLSQNDADDDGIPDREDALLFTPNKPIEFQIERAPLEPHQDGIPPKTAAKQTRCWDFCGPAVKPTAGVLQDHGLPFDAKRGYGWKNDLRENYRKRNVFPGSRDTFIFTRGRDRWEANIEPGKYRIIVCVGDSDHEQLRQSVTVQGHSLIERTTTASGEFLEAVIELDLSDERLKIEIGSETPNSNTCLNWIQVVRLSE